MPVYVALSRLTEEGSKTLKHKPDRILEVNSDLEAMGVKVLAQYAVLGNYDFVNILEAPDNDTIARMSVEIGARGSVRLHTMPALQVDELISDLKG